MFIAGHVTRPHRSQAQTPSGAVRRRLARRGRAQAARGRAQSRRRIARHHAAGADARRGGGRQGCSRGAVDELLGQLLGEARLLRDRHVPGAVRRVVEGHVRPDRDDGGGQGQLQLLSDGRQRWHLRAPPLPPRALHPRHLLATHPGACRPRGRAGGRHPARSRSALREEPRLGRRRRRGRHRRAGAPPVARGGAAPGRQRPRAPAACMRRLRGRHAEQPHAPLVRGHQHIERALVHLRKHARHALARAALVIVAAALASLAGCWLLAAHGGE